MVLYFTEHFHTCQHLCSIFYCAYSMSSNSREKMLLLKELRPLSRSQPSRYRFQDCRQITESCKLELSTSLKWKCNANLPDCDKVNERNYTHLWAQCPTLTAFMVFHCWFLSDCIQMGNLQRWVGHLYSLNAHYPLRETDKKYIMPNPVTMEV